MKQKRLSERAAMQDFFNHEITTSDGSGTYTQNLGFRFWNCLREIGFWYWQVEDRLDFFSDKFQHFLKILLLLFMGLINSFYYR